MSFSRASNSASLDQVCKCLKANLDTFQVLRETDPEKVVAYLVDLLGLTTRPLKSQLSQAARKSFEHVSTTDADFWAQQMVSAMQYCRNKGKCMTSGNKTNADVAAIAQILHGKAEPKRVVLLIGNLWKGTKKVMSPQKPKQSRVLVGHASSSLGGIGGTGSNASRSNILALYGISGDEMQKCQGRGIQVVSSSEEELAASSSSPAPQGPVVEYFDQELLCMKRVIGGGEATLAEMQEGQTGFLEYKWPGGDWLISEAPNLVLKARKKCTS